MAAAMAIVHRRDNWPVPASRTRWRAPQTLRSGSPTRDGGGAVRIVRTAATLQLPELDEGRTRPLPCGDALDAVILKFWIPAVLNLMMVPLVGAVDVFCVGRLGDARSLAALGASNQVFMSTVWVVSFLSTLVAPLVAEAAGRGDKEGLRRKLGEALFVSCAVGTLAMVLVFNFPEQMMRIVSKGGSEVLPESLQYLRIRSLTFVPMVCSIVSYAAFRGLMDSVTPLRISSLAQGLKAILDPVFIFGLGAAKRFGIAGVAVASSCGEIVAFTSCLTLLSRRGLIDRRSLTRVPPLASLSALLAGGAGVQVRSLTLNMVFLLVTQRVMSLDGGGTMAAAHAICLQFTQFGLLMVLSLGSIAAVIVPQYVNAADEAHGGADEGKDTGSTGATTATASARPVGVLRARRSADRLLCWGLCLGAAFGMLQLAMTPMVKYVTPIAEVQAAACRPFMIASILQVLNGVTFVSEGILQGHKKFTLLACSTVAAVGTLVASLQLMGDTLVGIWMSFLVFNSFRAGATIVHHFFFGPLSNRRVKQMSARVVAMEAHGGGVGGEGEEAVLA